MIAAIPKNVKSFTVNNLFNQVCSPSPPSFTIIEVDFFLKRLENDIVLFLMINKQIYKRKNDIISIELQYKF